MLVLTLFAWNIYTNTSQSVSCHSLNGCNLGCPAPNCTGLVPNMNRHLIILWPLWKSLQATEWPSEALCFSEALLVCFWKQKVAYGDSEGHSRPVEWVIRLGEASSTSQNGVTHHKGQGGIWHGKTGKPLVYPIVSPKVIQTRLACCLRGLTRCSLWAVLPQWAPFTFVAGEVVETDIYRQVVSKLDSILSWKNPLHLCWGLLFCWSTTSYWPPFLYNSGSQIVSFEIQWRGS